MPEPVARILLGLAGSYLAAGAIFALAFQAWGLSRVDPAARGASVGVRLVLSPGLVALWPALLLRWRRAVAEPGSVALPPGSPDGPRRLRAAHRVLAHALAVLAPLLLAAALLARPAEAPSQPSPSRVATP